MAGEIDRNEMSKTEEGGDSIWEIGADSHSFYC